MTGHGAPEDQSTAEAAAPAITGAPELMPCVPGRCQAPAGMHLGCDLLGCQKPRMMEKWKEALRRVTGRIGITEEEL